MDSDRPNEMPSSARPETKLQGQPSADGRNESVVGVAVAAPLAAEQPCQHFYDEGEISCEICGAPRGAETALTMSMFASRADYDAAVAGAAPPEAAGGDFSLSHFPKAPTIAELWDAIARSLKDAEAALPVLTTMLTHATGAHGRPLDLRGGAIVADEMRGHLKYALKALAVLRRASPEAAARAEPVAWMQIPPPKGHKYYSQHHQQHPSPFRIGPWQEVHGWTERPLVYGPTPKDGDK